MTWCGSHKTRPLRLASAWPQRLLLSVVAVAGTVAYSASFRTVPTAPGDAASAAWLAPAGAAVGAAAGVSWLAFGATLLLITGGRPSPMKWADACLRTM